MALLLLARYSSSMDREEILRALRAFEAAGLEDVVIGAGAMAFHGLVRATEDLDLLIRATPETPSVCAPHYARSTKVTQR